jgi:predicted Zn-dependent protease
MRRTCSERLRRAGAGCLLLLASAGCGTLSVSEEQRLGQQMSAQMRRELVFLPDRVVQGYVSRMGEELVAAAGPQPFRYRFFVVEDDEINAFAAPAGYVYVHTRTILAARNASELAGVIAHEVGHVALRHIANNYNRRRNTGIGYQAAVLAAAALGGGAAASMAQLGGGLAATAYLNSFSREDELAADAFAVEVMPRAGYDPQGLVRFFETLREQDSAAPPDFLSSHPATEARIVSAQQRIETRPPSAPVSLDDGGRFEIIKARIELLLSRGHRAP